jgi:arylsulfatase A-like enzyme
MVYWKAMKRPNILYIIADDLGWGDLRCHGSEIATPNIDLLMANGIELTQHYVCPMCTPTRASLLTGRYPGRFGPHATTPSNAPVFPDGYATLATMLRVEGYDTGLFGKWHLGSAPQWGPNHFGFNTSYGSLAGGVDPYNHRYKQGDYSFTWHRNGERVDERGHVTDLILENAISWLESLDPGTPWFCYVPFTAVHVPVKPTMHWLAIYGDKRFDDNPEKDLSFRKYAAYTSHMDWAVGELLEVLQHRQEREETIVIFTSDNGAINDCPLHGTDKYPGWQEAYPCLGSNAPFRGVKAQLYEGGIRVPTVVTWPGTLRPGHMDAPVCVVDWMPTFAAVTGAAPPTDACWDGRDIWPQITGEREAPTEREIFWNFRDGKGLAARRGHWKLIENIAEGHNPVLELFNITEDPYETRELSSANPGKVKELRDLIDSERQHDGASARSDVDGPGVQ